MALLGGVLSGADWTSFIKAGDRVTIVNRFGQQRTGRAVMRSQYGGWVLNMGGRHGTPVVATAENIVRVTPKQSPRRKG